MPKRQGMSDEPSGHLCGLNFKTPGKRKGSSKTSTYKNSNKQKMDQSNAFGDTGEDQRNAKQPLLMASEVTRRDDAGKMEKTKKPREGHFQCHSMNIDSSDNKGRYCGLENQGSTCYLNAVLQTLYMTKEFREHVAILNKEGVSSDGHLAEELNKLFNKLETKQKKAVSTTDITKSLGIRDVHKQRDAAEHLHLILEKTPGSSKLFKGTMKTTKTCSSCKENPQETSEDFFSFQMFFQNPQDVVDYFQACLNRMSGQHSSVHCGKIREIETKIEIKSPKHLIVEMTNSKNDMQVIIHPCIKDEEEKNYELYAVVSYKKRLRGAGCYNADIKCEDEIWRRFEDKNVSESSLNKFFRDENSTHRSSEACLLMYKHREQSQQSQFQTEVHHQGLEADKTLERDLSFSQADDQGQVCITQVQEAVHGVTLEEAVDALCLNQWKCTPAVQQLKVDQLFNMGQYSREQCEKTLISCHWDLEKASTALTHKGSQGTRGHQFSKL